MASCNWSFAVGSLWLSKASMELVDYDVGSLPKDKSKSRFNFHKPGGAVLCERNVELSFEVVE